jgi:hypothetical protein
METLLELQGWTDGVLVDWIRATSMMNPLATPASARW